MAKINICEGCDHGYHVDLLVCPYCGADRCWSAVQESVERVCDTECYPDYWLCKFDPPLPGTSGDYQLFPGHPLDRDGLIKILSTSTVISFNGSKYDLPMIAYALDGADNASLKAASDAIITRNLQPWQFYDLFDVDAPTWIDHIDLFDVAPGMTSLKEYGGKMHSRKIQDLPIDINQSINLFDRCELRSYCANDLQTTWDLYRTFPVQMKLRREMSAEYGIDLRSKSDAQIAEAIMKKLLVRKINRFEVKPGTKFHYRPPEWAKFLNIKVLDLLARSPFTVTDSGGIDMTVELSKTTIPIGRSKYKMGIGGLHSTESGQLIVADDMYTLKDVDVASYYPALIINLGLVPPAIGEVFKDIYRGWRDRRIAAKNSGDKKTADSLKTLLNGTFGKLGSKWSIFYTPSEFIQVTITGQIALLSLIEMLEAFKISVVSANTDGVVIRCRKDMEWLRDDILNWWREITGFDTEATDYLWIASRDVNNYIARPADLTKPPKLKGCYARPVPVATSWPNPTGEVCIDALVAFLTDGTPIPETIRACTDVRKFVHLRKVKGGGVWNEEFLGKAVRWYYSNATDAAEILYKSNGNKVAQSEGCRPIMELPEGYDVPADIDYDRYVADARAMLADLGVQE
jgi:hypothetical protein